MIKLAKLNRGDQVGIISPSAGVPEIFPHVFEQGLKRLREDFELHPIEYPTTRQMGSSLQDRARDIMAAFADTRNKAVFASIGGNDQIHLIEFLDKQIFLDNPKPFFGYSDNTHLQNFLWQLGIPSYYGGAIMLQFAWQKQMQDFTKHYLNLALFETGEFELKSSELFNDMGLDWADPENLNRDRKMESSEGWCWEGNTNASQTAEGVLWGGCVESIQAQLELDKYLPSSEALTGKIMFLETSEGIPDAAYVKTVLHNLGKKGLLSPISALIVGRPKAWEFNKQNSAEEKTAYKKEQRQLFIEVFRQYNTTAPIIQNMDFGHTDPQFALPNGQKLRIDVATKRIFATY